MKKLFPFDRHSKGREIMNALTGYEALELMQYILNNNQLHKLNTTTYFTSGSEKGKSEVQVMATGRPAEGKDKVFKLNNEFCFVFCFTEWSGKENRYYTCIKTKCNGFQIGLGMGFDSYDNAVLSLFRSGFIIQEHPAAS